MATDRAISDTLANSLLTAEAVADPYKLFEEMRAVADVHWSDRYRSWVFVGHEAVSSALKDTAAYSSDKITPALNRERSKARPDLDMIETLELLNDWIVFRDPPDHARLRRLVHAAFSPRVIAALKPQIHAAATELLGECVATARSAGSVDLIRELAYPLPAVVIAGMLGVPPEDRDKFREWADDIGGLVFGAFEDPDRYTRGRQGMGALVDYMGDLIERTRETPNDSLTSELLRASEAEAGVTQAELVAICVNLLFAGHETTTNLIANSVLQLMHHRDQWDALCREPDLAAGAVEEVLRFDGPAKSLVRVASADIEIANQQIASGDRVFLVLAAANRDSRVFDEPERFDITRKQSRHVAFGAGAHFCLGASLARSEGVEVLQQLATHYPGLALSDQQLTWDPRILTRALTRLDVQFQ